MGVDDEIQTLVHGWNLSITVCMCVCFGVDDDQADVCMCLCFGVDDEPMFSVLDR